MNEQQKELPPKKTDRRGLLKKITLGAAGIASAGILANEVQKGESGIKTDVGTFIPLYERHDKGVSIQSIPDGLDGFFKEFAGGKFMFESSPKDLFTTKSVPYGTSLSFPAILPFKDDTLEKLAKEHIEVMVGDILVSTSYDDVKEFRTELATTNAALFAALSMDVRPIGRSIDKKIGLARRKLLQKGFLGLGLWGLTAQRFLYFGAKSSSEKENAITRIAARIEGMGSQLHPELPFIFFRNLLMADKLLTVAEQMKKEKGKIPRIVFNVEGGHSGIEDFLQAGRDIIRKLILAYPEDWRNKVIELNGGPDNFCSTRLFKFPSDFKLTDLESDVKMERVSSRTIIDGDLKNAIIHEN